MISDNELKVIINKAKILGIIDEYNTYCGNKFYIIHKSNKEHLVIFPSNVTHPSEPYIGTETSNILQSLRGDIRVLGGLGLISTTNMFRGLDVTSLDLSKLYTPNLEDTSGMFKYTNLKQPLDISNLNLSKLKVIDEMFYGCDIPHINFGNIKLKDNIYMRRLFDNERTVSIDTIDTKIKSAWNEPIMYILQDTYSQIESIINEKTTHTPYSKQTTYIEIPELHIEILLAKGKTLQLKLSLINITKESTLVMSYNQHEVKEINLTIYQEQHKHSPEITNKVKEVKEIKEIKEVKEAIGQINILTLNYNLYIGQLRGALLNYINNI